ncbi:MAG TPA: glycosyltransferase, partial [Acidimicrobiales bacterium]|nr:glycosyltransferase [Acidimicrobiales bacterium]
MVAASREEKVAARDAQSEGQFVSPFARGFRIALDASVAKSDDGRVLVGGSRLKALRLEGREVDEIARLTQGEPALVTESNERLVRVLLDLEMAWPVPSGGSLGIGDVTVVVPVRDHSRHVERLLGAPGVFAGVAGIVLVDDGSQDGEARALEEICSSAAGIEVTLLRCDTSVGPAEARNLGAKRAVTEVLVFVDADCRPEPGWLEPLLAHFDDEVVGAVAPRLRAVRTSLNRSS